MTLFGAIEAGGTKFVCAVGSNPEDLRAEVRIPTTTPEETIAKVIDFFRQQSEIEGILDAIGIGAFGPADINPKSPTFGWLLNTPKPGWQMVDLVGAIERELNVPVGFDTDVNAAALGEHRWGNGRGLDTFLYLTIGTGIGGGGMVNGKLIHGLLHPEMGHILIPHDLSADSFPGSCPFHQDCWEGLASGFAMEQRWGKKASSLTADHPAWELEAHYLTAGLVNLILTLSPQRIIIGGGVMEQKQLFPLVRSQVCKQISSYVQIDNIMNEIDNYITSPKLGSKAGIMGAFALAQQSMEATL